MKFYLIRHGQTTGDIEDRYGGNYNDHLTEEGKVQARKLAEKLSSRQVKKLYTSPLFRAKETAEILKNNLACPLEIIPNIRERNSYGIMTSMLKAEAREKYPELVEQLKNPRNTVTGAEPYNDFKKRILDTLEKLAEENNEVFAIVTHGGPISLVFREVFGREVKKIADCGFVVLEDKKGKFDLIETDGVILPQT